MKHKIINNFYIYKIINSISILEFIKNNILLKNNGKYFYSLCPFHKEKKPSFFVYEEYKIFYCFGCKKKGNIINFLMNFKKINFKEAVIEISNLYNINININNYTTYSKYKFLYKKLFNISNLYNKNLLLNIKNKKNVNIYIKNKT